MAGNTRPSVNKRLREANKKEKQAAKAERRAQRAEERKQRGPAASDQDPDIAGIVPGLASLLIIPYVLYKIYPPELKRTPEAPLMAKEELEKMGPMDFNQKVMLCVFLGTILLWSTATFTGPTGTFRQRTDPTKPQIDLYARLDLPLPKKIIEISAAER